jgi:hypothetical protein
LRSADAKANKEDTKGVGKSVVSFNKFSCTICFSCPILLANEVVCSYIRSFTYLFNIL